MEIHTASIRGDSMKIDQRIDGILVTPAIGVETVTANIAATATRNLPEIFRNKDWREGVAIAIVGGGPSLKDSLPQLRKMSNIMVAGSAHDYVIQQGIKPRWCVVVDPDPIMANYLRHPVQGCTYLVASQCCSETFDALKGMDIVVWHAGCSQYDKNVLDVFGLPNQVLIGGGCTVGTRAIVIARLFGYFNIHLFGFDTCVAVTHTASEDVIRHHAYPFTDKTETVGRIQPVKFQNSDLVFMMADYHLGQLFDFNQILKQHSDSIRFTVHGDGALKELVRLGVEEAARLQQETIDALLTGEDDGEESRFDGTGVAASARTQTGD